MKKRVLLSSNYNPTYIQFVPLVCSVWKKWGYEVDLALVTNKDHKEWKWMEEYANIYPFDIRKDLDEGIWAKISRHFLTYLNPDDKVMLGDIDMIPLSKEYFDDLFDQLNGFPDSILLSGSDYNPRAHLPGVREKVPICYMVANGRVWRDIVNPQNTSIDEILNSWKGVNVYDKMEDITHKEFRSFSDESLYRRLLHTWNPEKDKMVFIKRGWTAGRANDRLDRSQWKIDYEKLKRGGYIDCHSLRPLAPHKSFLMPLIEYLGVNPELMDIGIEKSKI